MSSYWTVFVAVICLSGVSAMGEEVPTILAFGDSITAGGPRFVSYRKILVPELSKRNLSFRFIGPKKDATSAHAGYSGRSTKSLLKISADVYKKHPADIVLIHSGHNSFSKNKPVPGIVEDTAAIIANALQAEVVQVRAGGTARQAARQVGESRTSCPQGTT